MTTFIDLGLSEPITKALAEEGYTAPTPIQAQAIPGVLAGRDLLGIAQTGTGKTAAFALPILHRLAADRRPAPRKGCRALILSPTRELATQIGDSFRAYGRHLNMKVAVVFGGVGHRPQINALSQGVDVLVATPGRLIDHMDARDADISGTEVFVLDEADQMLDLGFVRPIRRIVSKLSMKRQNLFFSATMPSEIGALAAELLKEPVRVSVAPAATTVERVKQRVILIEQSKKRSLLVELLGDPEMSRTLIFTRTKRGADRVARHLEINKIEAAAIHGNKSQRQREEALERFKASEIRVLVATDIAARGIDIDLVTHVVNFEIPDVPEAYVHRIGRTARAGAEGIAISLVDHEERGQLRDIERTTRQQLATEDRRGDATLAADARIPAGRHEERRQGQRSERGGRDGESRSGRGRSHEHREERGARGGDRQGRGHGQGRGDRGSRGDGQPRGDRARHRDGERMQPQEERPWSNFSGGGEESREPRREGGERRHGGQDRDRRGGRGQGDGSREQRHGQSRGREGGRDRSHGEHRGQRGEGRGSQGGKPRSEGGAEQRTEGRGEGRPGSHHRQDRPQGQSRRDDQRGGGHRGEGHRGEHRRGPERREREPRATTR